ncbi:MAG: 3'-5' exonuclease [Candidatus Cyclobacteriaceae bacterium M2_1C_046]
MYQSTISNEEVNELPLGKFEGDVVIIDNLSDVKEAIAELKQEPALGFDTESKPAFRKGEYNPVALIQLAMSHKVYLFRINIIGFPTGLIEILTDPEILKIGAGLRDDLVELRRLQAIEPRGFLELKHAAAMAEINQQGLRKLSAIVLGFRISKSAQVSNWEKEELTEQQITYAATDAWVSLKIYEKLALEGYLKEIDHYIIS